MSVRLAKRYAALMRCVPTLLEATCALANPSILEMREHQTVAVTSTSARLWSDLAVRTLSAKTLTRVITAFVLKGTEPIQIQTSLANR